MYRLRTIVALFAFATALSANPAAADGPKFNAGKWQFDSRIVTTRVPEPKEETQTRCITEEQAKGDPLSTFASLGNCRIVSRKESTGSIEFAVDCGGQTDQKLEMRIHGTGLINGDGDTASGKMDLIFETPQAPDMSEVPSMPQLGGKMTLNQSWTGKRIGECD
jgi:hypothetical protein